MELLSFSQETSSFSATFICKTRAEVVLYWSDLITNKSVVLSFHVIWEEIVFELNRATNNNKYRINTYFVWCHDPLKKKMEPRHRVLCIVWLLHYKSNTSMPMSITTPSSSSSSWTADTMMILHNVPKHIPSSSWRWFSIWSRACPGPEKIYLSSQS